MAKTEEESLLRRYPERSRVCLLPGNLATGQQPHSSKGRQSCFEQAACGMATWKPPNFQGPAGPYIKESHAGAATVKPGLPSVVWGSSTLNTPLCRHRPVLRTTKICHNLARNSNSTEGLPQLGFLLIHPDKPQSKAKALENNCTGALRE